jgi:hypothetical protein
MQSIKRVEKVSTWSTQLRNSFFICKRLVHIRQSQMTSLLSSIAFSLIRRSRLHSQVSAPYLVGLISSKGPGTGKTYWAVPVFLLFLAYNNRHTGRRHQVMLLAPSTTWSMISPSGSRKLGYSSFPTVRPSLSDAMRSALDNHLVLYKGKACVNFLLLDGMVSRFE